MDADALRKQKDKAAEYVARGKLPQALEVYRGLVRERPADLALRQKLADLLHRTGKTREAVAEYDAVVQAYAQRGELLKAISLAKVILQVDPSHRGTEAKLAELYGQQLGDGPRFAPSAPMLGAGARPTPAPAPTPAAKPSSVPRAVVAPAPGRPPGARTAPPPRATPAPPPPAAPPADPFAPAPAVDPFAPVAALPPIVARPAPRPEVENATRVFSATPEQLGVYFDVEPEAQPPAPASASDDASQNATMLLSGPPPQGSLPLTGEQRKPSRLSMPDLPIPGRKPSIPPRPPSQPPPRAEPAPAPPRAPPEEFRTMSLPAYHEESASLELGVMREAEGRQTGRMPAWQTQMIQAEDIVEERPVTEPDTLAGDVMLPTEVPIPDQAPSGQPGALPHIPLFSDVPQAAFMALVAGAQVRTAAAGERLFEEGSQGDSLFAVVQGLVTLRKREGRRERAFGAMGPGEFFGEMSVVSDAPRLATVVAEDETVLLEFPRSQLAPILAQHSAVRRELERIFRERLLATVLRATPLFDTLDATRRAQLQAALELRTLPPEEAVLRHGQPPEGLFLLLRGVLSLRDPLATPRAAPLPDLEEGDFFGVLSALLGEPVKATLRARTACVLVRIPPTTLAELLQAQPVMRQLLAALARERWQLLTSRQG